MALVQYRDEVKGISVSKRMFAPKRMDSIKHWYTKARKEIPQIPDPESQDWDFMPPMITTKYIRWDIHKKTTGERVYVVIDRSVPPIG